VSLDRALLYLRAAAVLRSDRRRHGELRLRQEDIVHRLQRGDTLSDFLPFWPDPEPSSRESFTSGARARWIALRLYLLCRKGLRRVHAALE
jgi:hypothetical protein